MSKKVQYITIDSNNVGLTKNEFTIDLLAGNITGGGSSTTAADLNNVIGFKIVDAFFCGIGTTNDETNSPDYIDITCEDIPPAAQISVVNSITATSIVSVPTIIARIPLERSLNGSNGLIIYDKQWKPWPRQETYFNPLNLNKLRFKLYERLSSGKYNLMNFTTVTTRSFYFTIELTSLTRNM